MTFYIYDEIKNKILPDKKHFYLEDIGNHKDINIKDILRKNNWKEEYNKMVTYSNYRKFSIIKNIIPYYKIMSNKDILALLLKDANLLPETHIITIPELQNITSNANIINIINNTSINLPNDDQIWFIKKGGSLSYGGYDVYPIRMDKDGIRNTKDALIEMNKNIKYIYHRYIIQRGIINPMMIDKKKIDFRLYVLFVYMNNDLAVYFLKKGLIRKGYKEYDKDKIDKQSFITNNTYIKSIGILDYIHTEMYDEKHKLYYLWDKFKIKIKKISEYFYKFYKGKQVNHSGFHLFGFDFIVDNNDDVYLLEINNNPAIAYNEKQYRYTHHIEDDIFKDYYNIIFEAINKKKFSDGTERWIKITHFRKGDYE
jgi:hypothetical protein